MTLKIYVGLVLTLQGIILQGQNLVVNGSFEQLNKCIDDCSNPSDPSAIAINWFSATLQTPDVFSPCNSNGLPSLPCNIYSSPSNWVGFQYALEGSNYAGYFVGGISLDSIKANDFTDYIANKLKQPLEKKRYCISYAVNAAVSLYYRQTFNLDLILYAVTNKTGVYFSKTNPLEPTYGVYPQPPQVWLKSDVREYLSDTLGWDRVSNYYIAEGGEQYITIGNFVPVADLVLKVYTNMTQNQLDAMAGGIGCYQYIDDVQLIEIPELVVSKDTSTYIGSTVSLTCNTPTDGIAWFAGDTTNAIGTDSSIAISPNATTTYYLKANQCKLVTWDTVTITVLPKPIVPVNVWLSNTLTKDAFKINYTGDVKPELDVELFNSIGQLVARFKAAESVEVPITELAAGVYYCRVRSGEIPIFTDKILKIR